MDIPTTKIPLIIIFPIGLFINSTKYFIYLHLPLFNIFPLLMKYENQHSLYCIVFALTSLISNILSK